MSTMRASLGSWKSSVSTEAAEELPRACSIAACGRPRSSTCVYTRLVPLAHSAARTSGTRETTRPDAASTTQSSNDSSPRRSSVYASMEWSAEGHMVPKAA
eukprot:1957528-Pleurochrysis_carterae.AAC.2